MTGREGKIDWTGEVIAAQPRIRLMRSFDERAHSYLGYMLRVRGVMAGESREFLVAVGTAAHAKHAFRAGDRLEGRGVPVADPQRETADVYKVSGLAVLSRGPEAAAGGPPFLGVPPPLEVYRARGHRRLAAVTFAARCSTCLWGVEMSVEIVIDPWSRSRKRYRRETFCYGPKNCPWYAAGATRKVPGRDGMSWEEADWVDEDATGHRGPED